MDLKVSAKLISKWKQLLARVRFAVASAVVDHKDSLGERAGSIAIDDSSQCSAPSESSLRYSHGGHCEVFRIDPKMRF